MIKRCIARGLSMHVFVTVGICLSINTFSFGQDQSKLLGKVNIASPNAASLGKYGDIPVSYHTGVPNISIPLHTLSSGPINMSINLSYHAGGLRVEENDSWVGAGWSLNAGGVITRTVKDKPDERKTSSTSQTYGHFSDYGFNSIYATYGVQPVNETFDSEADLFNFNVGGYSGKFYFNDDRTPVLVPEQDVKIEYNYTPGQWNGSPGLWSGLDRCIEGFKITTPNGTKYYFGINPQAIANTPYCDPIEVTSTYTSNTGTSYSQVISSWYLYKVESADSNFKIELFYQRDRFAFYTYVNNLNSNSTQTTTRYSLVKNYVAGVQLSKVISKNAIADFIPGSAREDISGWNIADPTGIAEYTNLSSSTLGSVNISDGSGNCQKKFVFNYSYFVDNTSTLPSFFAGVTSDKKRLKLNSLQEQDCNGTLLNPPHSFEYFTEQVFRKLSFGRDHWGFNNGVTTNTELYPALYENTTMINANSNLPVGNRDAAWPAMRAGALKKIIYPTGGSTTFEFESHKFYVVENSTNVEKIIGGLRIKTITHTDPVASKSTVTNYSYTESSTGLSSGILYSKPTYIQQLRNDWMGITNYLPLGGACWRSVQSPNTVAMRQLVFSDNSLRPMETTQGNHIGYREVKVQQTGNGYSIYNYMVSQQINRDGIALTKVVNPDVCNTSYNIPAIPPATDFYRGELSSEIHFAEGGSKLNEKIYGVTYLENPVTIPGRLTYQNDDLIVETFYEIKTARKSQTTITEKTYQTDGSFLTNQVQTLYESSYHHEPTKVISTNSKGETNEKRLKYSFDYRVPVFESTVNCYSGGASFVSYFNTLLYSNGYATQFSSCGGLGQSCYPTLITNFYNALSSARKNYVDCRKTNYTNLYTSTTSLNIYQTNHNTAKANADAELKPILWMQDIYINEPIEVSEWKNNLLVGATFTKYNNLRDDELGLYPEKSFKIDLTTPSSSLSASSVGETGTTLTKDSRYTEQGTFDFQAGNVINVLGRDGIPSGYEWGYGNSLPIAKLINASNKYRDNLLQGTVSKSFAGFLGPSNSSFGQQIKFVQTVPGTITFSLPTPPNGAQVTGNYNLTGPVNQNGTICNVGTGGTSCSGVPSTISFSNMPAGTYTLSFSCNTTFGSFSFNYNFNYSYAGLVIQSSGTKEFFTVNFEEGQSGTPGTAHTGNMYLNGNYTTSWTPPNSRNYIIHWWNLSGGLWVFNSQAYTNGMVLTGPVDDVRIFPADAQVNTYTYNTSGNMTSETDTRGRTLYYKYDLLNRLVLITDNESNAIKKICYNYAGQVVNCSPAFNNIYFNSIQSQTFTRNNCNPGYTGTQVTYTVPANSYSSNISPTDANAKATADILANGQSYANTNGTCIQMFNITGTNSKPKAYTVSFSGTGGTTGSYSFTLPIGGNGVIGQVPSGTYNVSFSPQGSPITVTFNVNGFIQSGVQWATFYNISIVSNGTISVY